MVYESSYESGRQPFMPDTKRGHWASPQDYIYAGLSLAFRVDLFSMSWFMYMDPGVSTFLPVYLLSLALYIVPFMVILSFMGQFSSSGIISAFRLSPLFKGIGYVTLALNICVLAYYSIFAMVPLLYMFASMNPTLPWSCESFKKWATNLTEEEETNLCNLRLDNVTYQIESSGAEGNETIYQDYITHHIPSVLYFTTLFNDIYLWHYDDLEFSMSWQLIICALFVWTIVALVVYKLFNTETFGTIIRYGVWTMLGLLVLFLARFSFLPGAASVYHHVFVPSWQEMAMSIMIIPIYGISAFGPGWGLFISLSSYNQFNTNIIKSSWLIGLGQFFIILGLDLLINFTERYFGEITNGNYYSMVESIWILYLSSGSVMVHMGWANMWSILFYFMLFLAAMLLILIQLHSILTAIYDEFLFLRERKLQVAMGLIGFLTVSSLYFTSNHGISYFTALAADTLITHTLINLLIILVVLWIYGRVRFQRDIEFMTNQRLSTWNINILRFVAPLGMLLALMAGFFISHYEHSFATISTDLIAIFCIALPWTCIPAFAIYHMYLGIGPIKVRFYRCCRPTDWMPVDAENRQKYEEAMGNADITHTFSELRDEEVA